MPPKNMLLQCYSKSRGHSLPRNLSMHAHPIIKYSETKAYQLLVVFLHKYVLYHLLPLDPIVRLSLNESHKLKHGSRTSMLGNQLVAMKMKE